MSGLERELAEALHATGLNSVGRKPGSHDRFTEHCICNGDSAAIVARLLAVNPQPPEDRR